MSSENIILPNLAGGFLALATLLASVRIPKPKRFKPKKTRLGRWFRKKRKAAKNGSKAPSKVAAQPEAEGTHGDVKVVAEGVTRIFDLAEDRADEDSSDGVGDGVGIGEEDSITQSDSQQHFARAQRVEDLVVSEAEVPQALGIVVDDCGDDTIIAPAAKTSVVGGSGGQESAITLEDCGDTDGVVTEVDASEDKAAIVALELDNSGEQDTEVVTSTQTEIGDTGNQGLAIEVDGRGDEAITDVVRKVVEDLISEALRLSDSGEQDSATVTVIQTDIDDIGDQGLATDVNESGDEATVTDVVRKVVEDLISEALRLSDSGEQDIGILTVSQSKIEDTGDQGLAIEVDERGDEAIVADVVRKVVEDLISEALRLSESGEQDTEIVTVILTDIEDIGNQGLAIEVDERGDEVISTDEVRKVVEDLISEALRRSDSGNQDTTIATQGEIEEIGDQGLAIEVDERGDEVIVIGVVRNAAEDNSEALRLGESGDQDTAIATQGEIEDSGGQRLAIEVNERGDEASVVGVVRSVLEDIISEALARLGDSGEQDITFVTRAATEDTGGQGLAIEEDERGDEAIVADVARNVAKDITGEDLRLGDSGEQVFQSRAVDTEVLIETQTDTKDIGDQGIAINVDEHRGEEKADELEDSGDKENNAVLSEVKKVAEDTDGEAMAAMLSDCGGVGSGIEKKPCMEKCAAETVTENIVDQEPDIKKNNRDNEYNIIVAEPGNECREELIYHSAGTRVDVSGKETDELDDKGIVTVAESASMSGHPAETKIVDGSDGQEKPIVKDRRDESKGIVAESAASENVEENISVAETASDGFEYDIIIAETESESSEGRILMSETSSENFVDDKSVAETASENIEDDISVAETASDGFEYNILVTETASENSEYNILITETSEIAEVDISVAETASENVEDDISVAETASENVEDDISVAETESDGFEYNILVTETASENSEYNILITETSENADVDISVAETASENVEDDISVAETASDGFEYDIIIAETESESSEGRSLMSETEISSTPVEDNISVAETASEGFEYNILKTETASENFEDNISVAETATEGSEYDIIVAETKSENPEGRILMTETSNENSEDNISVAETTASESFEYNILVTETGSVGCEELFDQLATKRATIRGQETNDRGNRDGIMVAEAKSVSCEELFDQLATKRATIRGQETNDRGNRDGIMVAAAKSVNCEEIFDQLAKTRATRGGRKKNGSGNNDGFVAVAETANKARDHSHGDSCDVAEIPIETREELFYRFFGLKVDAAIHVEDTNSIENENSFLRKETGGKARGELLDRLSGQRPSISVGDEEASGSEDDGGIIVVEAGGEACEELLADPSRPRTDISVEDEDAGDNENAAGIIESARGEEELCNDHISGLRTDMTDIMAKINRMTCEELHSHYRFSVSNKRIGNDGHDTAYKTICEERRVRSVVSWADREYDNTDFVGIKRCKKMVNIASSWSMSDEASYEKEGSDAPKVVDGNGPNVILNARERLRNEFRKWVGRPGPNLQLTDEDELENTAGTSTIGSAMGGAHAGILNDRISGLRTDIMAQIASMACEDLLQLTDEEEMGVEMQISAELKKLCAQQNRVRDMTSKDYKKAIRKIKPIYGYPAPSKLSRNPPSIMTYPTKTYQKFTRSLKRIKYSPCPEVSLEDLFLSGDRVKFVMYKSTDYAVKISSGSFGDVYLGKLDDSELVVIKLFCIDTGSNTQDDFKLIAKEIAITQRLHATGYVAKLIGLVAILDTPFHHTIGLVLEHVGTERLLQKGGSSMLGTMQYDKKVKTKLFKSTLIPRRDLKRICYYLSDGLAKIHEQQILHNDLKLDNLLLSLENGHYKPRFVDFGMATAMNDKPFSHNVSASDLKSHKENFPHHAPETYSGGPATTKSDIYSLGLVLKQMSNLYGLKDWLKELANLCKHRDPQLRPTARNVADVIKWGFSLDDVD